MNKVHENINWENYPSGNTPINESNLNKMDKAIDLIDDRVVTHETTKLDVITANSMVKDVTFDEATGVFTITKLNGSKVTINTSLEKIATNFKYDYSTQKLILTLIDGTTQEVDLSALLTQYEFVDGDIIMFSIDSNGKVSASIKNGSITAEKLQPNFLADVTLQANNAATSAENAKESEEKAAEYAEDARLSAESAEPVAGKVSGTNPTAQDSTDAPLIYLKVNGSTTQDGEPTPDNPIDIVGVGESGSVEVKTTGKNLLNIEEKITGVITTDGNISVAESYYFHTFVKVKPNTTYTLSNTGGSGTGYQVAYYDVNKTYIGIISNQGNPASFTTPSDCYYVACNTNSNCAEWQLELGNVATEYETYTETTASIPTDAPLYEGDYLEVYADGSGKLVRKRKTVVIDGSQTVYSVQDGNNGGKVIALHYNVIMPDILRIRDVNNKTCDKLSPPSTEFPSSYKDCKIGHWGFNTANNNDSSVGDTFFIFCVDEEITTVSEAQTWLQSNPITIVYELATPTETPLTAEQVAEFKKLYTFENTTNVFCDGEVEVLYLKNTDGGKAVASLKRGVEHADTADKDGNGNVITDTYATNNDLNSHNIRVSKELDVLEYMSKKIWLHTEDITIYDIGEPDSSKYPPSEYDSKLYLDVSNGNLYMGTEFKSGYLWTLQDTELKPLNESILSTIEECTASTNASDIAGASALAELSNKIGTITSGTMLRSSVPPVVITQEGSITLEPGGLYFVQAYVRWSESNATGFRSIAITGESTPKYGLSAYPESDSRAAIGTFINQRITAIMEVSSTSTTKYLHVYQNSGVTIKIDNSFISAIRIK